MTATIKIDSDVRGAEKGLEDTRDAVEGVERALDGTAPAATKATRALDDTADASESLTREQRRLRQQVEDTDGALDDLRKTADKVAESADGAGQSAGGFAGMLGGRSGSILAGAGLAGVALGGFTLALGGVKAGLDAAWESTERFFQAANRDDLWSEVERTARGYTGTLFELVIGTDDAEEAHRRLTAILEDGLVVVDAMVSALQPFAAILRGAVSGALGVAASAFGDTRSVIGGFRDEIDGLVSDLNAYRAAMAETLAITDPTDQMWEQYTLSVERLAEITATATQNIQLFDGAQRLSGNRTLDLLGNNEEFSNQVRTQLTPQLLDLIYTSETLADANGRLTAEVEYLGTTYTAVIPDAASALQRMAGAYDDAADAERRFMGVREQTLDAADALRDPITLDRDTGGGGGGGGGPSPGPAIDEAALKRERQSLAAQQAKIRELEFAASAAAELGRIEAESAQQRLQMEAERIAELERIQTEAAERRLRIQEQAAEATGAAFLRAGEAMAQSLGAGVESGADRARKVSSGLMADLLDMLARTTLATAGVTSLFDVFSGGLPNPAKAAGMVVAAGSLKVASAFVRGIGGAPGGGGGGGGGAVPSAAVSAPISQSSTTTNSSTAVTVNYGIVGDPRQAASLVAQLVQRGQREGMYR